MFPSCRVSLRRPTPNAFGAALPLSYPGFARDKMNAALRDVNRRRRGQTASLLFLHQIGLEELFAASDGGHETNPVALRHGAAPSFLLDETPVGKIFDTPGLGVCFGREQKELHPFFRDPNLGDVMDVFMVEDPCPQSL